MKITVTFQADVQDIDMSSLQDFVDGINHKDTVKIYSDRIESEYGFDDAEAEAEGDDAEAEEDEGVEEDEQTDQ